MRITGGVFRSRTLVVPHGQTTRPTSDRVREALFSMLVSDGVFSNVDEDTGGGREMRVLDLYAGSGALGLEAISRGAHSAVLVEHGRQALAAIRENTRALNVEAQVTVLAMKVDRAIATLEAGAFDLVLIDPPYDEVRAPGFAVILTNAARLLTTTGVLVLEHASSDDPNAPPDTDLHLDRRRRHGDTTLSLFARMPPSRNPPSPTTSSKNESRE